MPNPVSKQASNSHAAVLGLPCSGILDRPNVAGAQLLHSEQRVSRLSLSAFHLPAVHYLTLVVPLLAGAAAAALHDPPPTHPRATCWLFATSSLCASGRGSTFAPLRAFCRRMRSSSAAPHRRCCARTPAAFSASLLRRAPVANTASTDSACTAAASLRGGRGRAHRSTQQ